MAVKSKLTKKSIPSWTYNRFYPIRNLPQYSTFEELYPVLEFPFFMQRKLFGERAIYSSDHKFFIPNYPEFISDKLKHLYVNAPQDWVLDGVLVVDDGRECHHLPALNNFLKNGGHLQYQIRFIVYDLYVRTKKDLTYEERLELLANELLKISVPGVTYTMSAKVTPQNFPTIYSVLSGAQKHTVLIRDTDARYQPGKRSLSCVEATQFSFITAKVEQAYHTLKDLSHLQLKCSIDNQTFVVPYHLNQLDKFYEEDWYVGKEFELAVYNTSELLFALGPRDATN